MSSWSAIDGNMAETWEYVSLGIVEDLGRMLAAIDGWLPQAGRDDSALTRALSSYRSSGPIRTDHPAAALLRVVVPATA